MAETFPTSSCKDIRIKVKNIEKFEFTMSGLCPQANPIPRSPIPWGQDKFSSRASGPATQGININSVLMKKKNPVFLPLKS